MQKSLVTLLIVCFCPLQGWALDEPVNRRIPYQGQLTDTAGDPITDPVNAIFRLYNGAAQLLWGPELHAVDPDENGNFVAILGSSNLDQCKRCTDGSQSLVCPAPAPLTQCPIDLSGPVSDEVFDLDQIPVTDLMLEVTIDDGINPPAALSPLQRIVPAFHASTADVALTVASDSIDSSSIVDNSVTSDDLAPEAVNESNIQIVAGELIADRDAVCFALDDAALPAPVYKLYKCDPFNADPSVAAERSTSFAGFALAEATAGSPVEFKVQGMLEWPGGSTPFAPGDAYYLSDQAGGIVESGSGASGIFVGTALTPSLLYADSSRSGRDFVDEQIYAMDDFNSYGPGDIFDLTPYWAMNRQVEAGTVSVLVSDPSPFEPNSTNTTPRIAMGSDNPLPNNSDLLGTLYRLDSAERSMRDPMSLSVTDIWSPFIPGAAHHRFGFVLFSESNNGRTEGVFLGFRREPGNGINQFEVRYPGADGTVYAANPITTLEEETWFGPNDALGSFDLKVTRVGNNLTLTAWMTADGQGSPSQKMLALNLTSAPLNLNQAAIDALPQNWSIYWGGETVCGTCQFTLRFDNFRFANK